MYGHPYAIGWRAIMRAERIRRRRRIMLSLAAGLTILAPAVVGAGALLGAW